MDEARRATASGQTTRHSAGRGVVPDGDDGMEPDPNAELADGSGHMRATRVAVCGHAAPNVVTGARNNYVADVERTARVRNREHQAIFNSLLDFESFSK